MSEPAARQRRPAAEVVEYERPVVLRVVTGSAFEPVDRNLIPQQAGFRRFDRQQEALAVRAGMKERSFHFSCSVMPDIFRCPFRSARTFMM